MRSFSDCYVVFKVDLRLRKNKITGKIPESLSAATNLSKYTTMPGVLLVSNTIIVLTSSLCRHAVLLYLDDNRLSGTVPEIFDRLTHLSKIGGLATCFISQDGHDLTSYSVIFVFVAEIQLYGNQLEGRLPGSIKFCVNLRKFISFQKVELGPSSSNST